MYMMPMSGTASSLPQPSLPVDICNVIDPLDDDLPGDEVVITTRRGICRVALVATEVADRFQREGLRYDAMTWMLAPRRLFGGASAIDACLDRDACLRGVLIHGLSLGLDAEPETVDALTGDDDGDLPDACGIDGGNVLSFERPGVGTLRLFTATVVSRADGETIQAFHASLAVDGTEVAGRLYDRIGAASVDALVVEGFDPGNPLVTALVSPAMCDTLELIAGDPGSPLAAGLDIYVEQRFFG